MKVCVIGAAGNSGRSLVRSALTRGHHVTALARDPAKVADLGHDRLSVLDVPLEDYTALTEALGGHDVVINAAGNVADGAAFTALAAAVIRAADAALSPGSRFWLFGGAALLDVPTTDTCTLNLPGVPKFYEAHRTNYRAVCETGLDWSMLCPGPMIESPNGKATEGLIVSTEVWPTPRPVYTHMLPPIALALAFKQAVPRMTIYYEDAAKVILDNLETEGPYSRKRVGIALPNGEVRLKPAAPR